MIKSKGILSHLVNKCSKIFKELNWIKEADYKGSDLYGNYFFETKYRDGRVRRFAESNGVVVTPDKWNDQISPEWESWLRYRRNDPPLDEELLRNEAIAYLKKQRSQALLAKEIEDYPDSKLGQKAEASPIYSSFPIYKDMETSPGSMEAKFKRRDQIDGKKEVPKLTE